jgi:TP901 family phage tail tape measure protein
MAMNLEAVLKISAQVIGQDGVDRLRTSIGGLSTVAESAKRGFTDVVNSAGFQALAVGAAAVGVALGTSVQEAVKFETAMADVRKVVPGLESADGLREMKTAVIDLSRELPISAQGIADIVAAAGQAGIEKDGLVEFARAAGQMAVAFDMTAAEAGDAMAKMRTSMGLSQPEVESLADAMNYLSNVQASSASEITDFMLRVGAFGQQVAMTEEQTAAMGSAMIAAGAAPDVAATSFRNLIKEMAAGPNATKKQNEAWSVLGLTATGVASAMQKDAVPTIRDVFQRLAALPAEMRIPMAEALFGNEARALAPLLSNMKLFDESMAAIGDKTNYAGSMMKEFDARAGTSANSWQLLMNNVKALQIAIGDALLPALVTLLNALTPVVMLISKAAMQFPWLTTAIVAIVGAFAGLVAIMPLIASFLYAMAQLAAMGVTFGGIGAAIVGVGATIAGWAGIVMPILAAVGGALSSLGTILLGIFTGPVGWVALLVAAAVALFAFREPIMAFFVWVGEAFTAWIASLVTWAGPFTMWWVALWEQVKVVTMGWFTWLGTALYTWFVQPWITIGQALIVAMTALWEQVKVPVMGFFTWWGTILYQVLIEPWVVALQALAAGAQLAWASMVTTWNAAIQQLVAAMSGIVAAFYGAVVVPMQSAWAQFTQSMAGMLQVAVGTLQGIWQSFSSVFVATVVQPMLLAWESMLTGMGVLIQSIATSWNAIWLVVMQSFAGISVAFQQNVTAPILSAWTALNTGMASVVQRAATVLQGAYGAIAGSVVGAFRGVIGTVGRVINSIIAMINKLIAGVNTVRSAVGLSMIGRIPLVDIPSFAKGGVVNRPTVALIGEGGEPEYIVPESRMGDAARSYLDGARGQAVLSATRPRSPATAAISTSGAGGPGGGVMVNITTGPVIEQGGERYATLVDLEGAVRQTATQIYATLRTPAGRRAIGVA